MRPISIDEFCNFKFISGMRFSPQGSNLCFAVSNAQLKDNTYESFLYKMEDGQPVQLTAGGKEGSFLFLDEDTLLFAGDRDASSEKSIASKYYRISLKGGEAKKAYTFPIPTSNLMPLANGDFVLSGTIFPGYEDLYKGDSKLTRKYLAEREENADYEVITENPWWWNGSTYTRGAYEILFYYDAKSKKLRPLTDSGYEVSGAKLSSDEAYVYYWSMKKEVVNRYYELDLLRLRLADGSKEVIFHSTKALSAYSYYLGQSFGILALSDTSKMGGNSNPDFYRFDYETLEVIPYAKFGEAIGTSVGTDVRRGGGYSGKMVGDVLYFTSTLFDSCYLMKLEDGVISKVIDKEGSVDGFDVTADGSRFVLSALWDMKGIELYDINCKPLTHFNDKVLRGKYTAIPERCDAFHQDHDIHGFVLKPMGYDPAKKYPVILDIHGGPKTVYGPVYYHEMQYWASRGFFVIFCNPTGSDGRGDAFADITGKYGTVDFEDIMLFVDKALETYPAMDADRLFETGGSYGGFMTNWIVGHTNRFRACATQRSIVNWFSFFGVSDIGLDFTMDQNLSDPWKNPEKLWFHSPMKYLDQCKTPTLIIHSEQDYRCPVDQGYQMYSSLVANGVESKMVLFKGENHDLSRSGKPKHRIRRIREITEWFERHM